MNHLRQSPTTLTRSPLSGQCFPNGWHFLIEREKESLLLSSFIWHLTVLPDTQPTWCIYIWRKCDIGLVNIKVAWFGESSDFNVHYFPGQDRGFVSIRGAGRYWTTTLTGVADRRLCLVFRSKLVIETKKEGRRSRGFWSTGGSE